MKAFAFFPSPHTLLALLHLFAPFFTPNRLKSGALQWGEGRKTKNGCDVYAREAERSPHTFTPSGRFSFPRFHLARGGEHRSLVSSDIPLLSTKNGEVFSVLSTAVGDRWRARSFAPCPSPKVCSTKCKAGCKIITFRWHFRGNPLYLQQNLHRGRRTTPHSHPYEETAVSPSQRRRLLPHHQ